MSVPYLIFFLAAQQGTSRKGSASCEPMLGGACDELNLNLKS